MPAFAPTSSPFPALDTPDLEDVSLPSAPGSSAALPAPAAPDIPVQVPGVGTIAFPGTMSVEEIQTALRRLYPPPPPGVGGYTKQVLGELGRGLAASVTDIPKFVGAARRAADTTLGPVLGRVATLPLGIGNFLSPDTIDAIGQWGDEAAAKVLPNPVEGTEGFWSTTVPHSVGSLVGFVAGTKGLGAALRGTAMAAVPKMVEGMAARMLAKSAGKLTQEAALSAADDYLAHAAAAGALGAMQSFTGGYHDALSKLSPDDPDRDTKAATSAVLNAAVAGPTMAVPFGRWFGKLNRFSGGTLARSLMEIGTEGATFAGMNAALQTWGNVVADKLAGYDPGRDWTEGVLPSAETGAVGGVLMGALVAAMGRKRMSLGAELKAAIQTGQSEKAALMARQQQRMTERAREVVQTHPEIAAAAKLDPDLQRLLEGDVVPLVGEADIAAENTRTRILQELGAEQRAEQARQADAESTLRRLMARDVGADLETMPTDMTRAGSGERGAENPIANVDLSRANVEPSKLATIGDAVGGKLAEIEARLKEVEKESGVRSQEPEAPRQEPGASIQNPEVPAPSSAEKLNRRMEREANRPWDIIDEVEGNFGGIDPKLIREADPNWKPSGAARKLFKPGGSPADVVADALARAGIYKGDPGQPDQLGEALNAAAAGRKAWRTRQQQENRELKKADAFLTDINDVRKRSGPVLADDLGVGDTVLVKGRPLKVTALEFDADGYVKSVRFEDGAKYGVQEVPGGTQLQVDDGRVIEAKPPETRTSQTDDGNTRVRVVRHDFEHPDELRLESPESVEEQKARFAEEQRKAESGKRKAEMLERAAAPLRGGTGDLGQRDLLGKQDLFGEGPGPRQYAPAPAGTAQAILRGTTVGELLKLHAQDRNNPWRHLARILLRLADRESLNVPIRADVEAQASRYRGETDDIILSRKGALRAETQLHEILHALTVKKLPSDLLTGDLSGLTREELARLSPGGRRLVEAFQRARQAGDYAYGHENLAEFLSEAFSNPEFQAQLAGIKTDERTVWRSFVDAIRRVLGLPESTYNLLDQVLRDGAEVVSQPRAERGGQVQATVKNDQPVERGQPAKSVDAGGRPSEFLAPDEQLDLDLQALEETPAREISGSENQGPRAGRRQPAGQAQREGPTARQRALLDDLAYGTEQSRKAGVQLDQGDPSADMRLAYQTAYNHILRALIPHVDQRTWGAAVERVAGYIEAQTQELTATHGRRLGATANDNALRWGRQVQGERDALRSVLGVVEGEEPKLEESGKRKAESGNSPAVNFAPLAERFPASPRATVWTPKTSVGKPADKPFLAVPADQARTRINALRRAAASLGMAPEDWPQLLRADDFKENAGFLAPDEPFRVEPIEPARQAEIERLERMQSGLLARIEKEQRPEDVEHLRWVQGALNDLVNRTTAPPDWKVTAEMKALEVRELRERIKARVEAGDPVDPGLRERLRAAEADFDAALAQAGKAPGKKPTAGAEAHAVPTAPPIEDVAPRVVQTMAPAEAATAIKVARDWPGLVRSFWGALRADARRFANLVKTSAGRDFVSYTKDAADNQAAILGRRAGNLALHELNRAFGAKLDARDEAREFALTFAIEADGDKLKLEEFRDAILGSQHARGKWAQKALAGIGYAEKNWARLQPVAEVYKNLTDAEILTEQEAGLDIPQRSGGYVMHRQDVMEGWENVKGQGGATGQPGTPFRHIRDWPTYAEAIANGVTPESLNAVDLLQARVSMGRKAVNYRQWMQGLKDYTDPGTQEPIATEAVKRLRIITKEDGAKETQPDITAPAGYHLENFAGLQIAVHNSYAGLFSKLTSGSKFREGYVAPALMRTAGVTKNVTLLFDTFHLGRLMFWNAMNRMGAPDYRKGLTLLDTSRADLREMARRGEIPQEWLPELEKGRKTLDTLLEAGLNVGGIADNLHTEWLKKLPVIKDTVGRFNSWLFEQYQRGAMVECGLIEFARQQKLRPGESSEAIARRVAVNLNTRFGSLGSQGWIKSKTFQDLARLVFLAPQWNEGLIRSEVGAVKQLLTSPVESFKEKRLVMGALGRTVGTAALGMFLGNQIINYITRGQPTWENEEEDFGAKLSAWIPDAVGGGPGFLLNPMSLPFEVTHLLEKWTEKTGDVTRALRQFVSGRLNAVSRPLWIFVTGETVLGRKMRTPGEKLLEMAGAAVPRPIGVSSYVRGAQQLATGENQEAFPGQFQSQIMQSFGVKTDRAPSAEQRIRALARDFNERRGVVPSGEFFTSDYQPLEQALRMNNRTDIQDTMTELMEKKTPQQIREHFEKLATIPFTRNRAAEAGFRRELDPEQMATYRRAVADRRALFQKFMEAWRQARASGVGNRGPRVAPLHRALGVLADPGRDLDSEAFARRAVSLAA